jgi:molybdopterin-guanine dinucleotide biosynthesis protein A
MMAPQPRAPAYVLVGRATRFPDKFERRIDGVAILDRVLDRVREAGFSPTIVASAPVRSRGIARIEDRYDRGPLGAVRTVLEHAPGPFLLVGGDMPFLSPPALARLASLHRPGRSIVPRRSDGALEVLHAFYDLSLPAVKEAWEAGRSLRDVVRADPRTRYVSVESIDPSSFVDIDTPEDWLRRAGRADRATVT